MNCALFDIANSRCSGQVYTNADSQVGHATALAHALKKDACNLTAPQQNVIGPFQSKGIVLPGHRNKRVTQGK